MQIVGFSGKIGTGKSTAAKALVSKFPEGMAKRVAYGDLLKEEVSNGFKIPLDWCYNQNIKENVKLCMPEFLVHAGYCEPQTVRTLRQVLQWWGTEYRRAQDPAYWIKAMADRLAQMELDGVRCAVIDDVRFVDEAEYILHRGGQVYRILPFPGWLAGPYAAHTSETALDLFEDFTARFYPQFGGLEFVADTVYRNLARGPHEQDS